MSRTTMNNPHLFLEFHPPYPSDHTLVIEEDDRVAFAYLLQHHTIVADVWLYNQRPALHQPIWEASQGGLPPVNPPKYLRTDTPGLNADLVQAAHAEWQPDTGKVTLHFPNGHRVQLAPGWKPGYSTLVATDGPLARKWMP